MSARTALVVGGTGPTGPDIVNGLVARRFRTAIFHSGRHEVDLPAEVEHVHGDAHFPESIEEALGSREFDVVIAQYGRLRHLAHHFRGKTGHLVAIGGFMGPLAASHEPRWGPVGRPALVREGARVTHSEDPAPSSVDKLGLRMAQANQEMMALRAEGAYKATHIGYPLLYGPRQPAPMEWSIIRRLLDGRRHIVLPDGGLRLDSRGYVGNVSLAPLLAIDRPETADGKSYVVTDRDLFTTRQRVEFIAAYLNVSIDIVDMPYDLATPAHPLYRTGPGHRAGTAELIRSELGYVDQFDVADSLRRTVDWLRSDAADVREIETQLSDPFDYEFEDRLIDWWRKVREAAPLPDTEYAYQHNYRHPKQVSIE